MSPEHVIEALALLNLLQFGFWGFVVNKLVNKVMCKNFAEYSMIKNGPPKLEAAKEDFGSKEEEQEILDEVNSMFGAS